MPRLKTARAAYDRRLARESRLVRGRVDLSAVWRLPPRGFSIDVFEDAGCAEWAVVNERTGEVDAARFNRRWHAIKRAWVLACREERAAIEREAA